MSEPYRVKGSTILSKLDFAAETQGEEAKGHSKYSFIFDLIALPWVLSGTWEHPVWSDCVGERVEVRLAGAGCQLRTFLLEPL